MTAAQIRLAVPAPQPISLAAKQAVENLLTPPQSTTPPQTDMDSYKITPEVARAPLASADVDALVARAMEQINEEHLVFPETGDLVTQAVVGLLGGHLILHGPPGTGKTRLAAILAEAFECDLQTETGTPDWSTYDVIGGLRPAQGDLGEELRPTLGHVPRAALLCAEVVAKNLAGEEQPQAHWLMIDELSRADIDKAIGPLYTALSGTKPEQRTVNLWFEDAPQRSQVTLPERFRLIGTMNDVDTAFVSQLSQGLQRRFEFVHIGVPTADGIEAELKQVSRQAAKWYGGLYASVTDFDGYAEAFVDEPRVKEVLDILGGVVAFLRWDDGGPRWPVGSAQLADVMRRIALVAFSNKQLPSLVDPLDRAFANRVIQQTSALTADQMDQIQGGLSTTPLKKSLAALAQVRTPHLTHRS